jgi:hypothetical protein
MNNEVHIMLACIKLIVWRIFLNVVDLLIPWVVEQPFYNSYLSHA